VTQKVMRKQVKKKHTQCLRVNAYMAKNVHSSGEAAADLQLAR